MEYTGTSETFSFQEVEVKGERQYYISGYISTKNIDTFNDLVTDECLDDMLAQVQNSSIKMDEEHETIHKKNLDINPIARIVESKKDAKGLWVKALLNKANPRFQEAWESIKNGFYDSFSIAFKPIEAATRYIQGKAVRVLNKLKLVNVGITGTPVNEECKMDNIIVKALTDMEKRKITEEYEDANEDEDEVECKSELIPLDSLSDEELELKHKYIKRTGSPGNYTYFYSNKEYEDYKKSKNSNSLFAKEDYKQKVLDSFSKDELKDFKEVLSDENKKYIVQTWFGRNNLGKDYKLNDKFDEMLNEEKGEKHLKELLMNIPMNELQEMKKDIKEKPKGNKNNNPYNKKEEKIEKKSEGSYSTEQSEDNNKMAESEETKPSEQPVTEESEVVKTEETKVDNSEAETEEDEAKESEEVKELKDELAEVKSQLADVLKQLAKPELKAKQENQPINKLEEKNVTPLGLIG